MGYVFVSGYKTDEKRRASFCRLAKDTFGIDLERWFQLGFWNENYICYSLEYEGEIVSNVSVNLMRLIMDGRRTDAIQIGTVMTRPDHRRKGLAKKLVEKVMEIYSGSFFFLTADKEAVPLYESCGFRPAETFVYELDIKGYERATINPEPVDVSPEELVRAKRMSAPLSQKLSAVGDEHVLMFYYLHGFASHIYRPWSGVYAIMKVEGDSVHVFDILSPEKVALEDLISAAAPQNAVRAVCHFNPDGIKGIKAMPEHEGWMVSGGEFPAGASFPHISQA